MHFDEFIDRLYKSFFYICNQWHPIYYKQQIFDFRESQRNPISVIQIHFTVALTNFKFFYF